MDTKRFLAIACVLLMTACATGGGVADPNESMVIVGAKWLPMDSGGHIPERKAVKWAYGMSLRNIVTGVTRNVPLQQGHAVVTLPSGIYCIYTLQLYYPDDHYPYCKEPFMKLEPGVVANSGYFEFALDLTNGRFELYKSAVDGDELEKSLISADRDAIQKFKDAHPVLAPPAP